MSLERFLNGGLAWNIDTRSYATLVLMDVGDMVNILPLSLGYVALVVTRGTDITLKGVGVYDDNTGKITGFLGNYKAQLSFVNPKLQVFVDVPTTGGGPSPDGGGTSLGPVGT